MTHAFTAVQLALSSGYAASARVMSIAYDEFVVALSVVAFMYMPPARFKNTVLPAQLLIASTAASGLRASAATGAPSSPHAARTTRTSNTLYIVSSYAGDEVVPMHAFGGRICVQRQACGEA